MVVLGGITFKNSLNLDLILLHSKPSFMEGFPQSLPAGDTIGTRTKNGFCVGIMDRAIYKIHGSNHHIVRITIGDDDPGNVEAFSVDPKKTDVLNENSKDAKKLVKWANEGLPDGVELTEFYVGEYNPREDTWELREKY